MPANRSILVFSVLIFICAAFFVADIIWGSVTIPFVHILQLISGNSSDEILKNILFEYRIPKALTAILAGAGLSVCGLQLQTLFRNPLAGPDVLGISSGASLGVALTILSSATDVLSMGSFNTQFSAVIAASMGAVAILFLILLVSFRIRNYVIILILGLMLGQMTSAIVGLLQYFSSASELQGFVLWGMGNFGNVSGSSLWILSFAVFIGMLIAIASTKYLNLIVLGEKYAVSMGLNLKLLRFLVIISTGLMTGSITAYCGPIAFIGVAVPQLAKRILKTSDHLVLIPLAALCGAGLALACDVIAHLPFLHSTLPVNIITSVIGAPIVIWVLLKQRNIHQSN